MNTSQKLAAEFIGTFTLTFIGVSSICVNAGLPGVALAHGLAIAVMVAALGYISGGFFNPAVTFGAWVGGKIDAKNAILYSAAQLSGALVGALAVRAVFPASTVELFKLGTPMLAPDVGVGAGILIELILTFLLVLVVYGSAIDSRGPGMGGLFVGLTITADILAGGPMTGASMNPARTFGPALAGGYWENHLVYWIGPMLGAGLAALVYKKLLAKPEG
ncbi:MAG TPA: MIP/aquaporin family protein [Bacteroidota bacterium]|nr:MIP/aquaporin family protein [Bacteroidota bacterium]